MEHDRSLLDTSKVSLSSLTLISLSLSVLQLDENIRRLLERFDVSTSTEENDPSSTLSNADEASSTPGEEVRSYIRQLNTWLREDLDGHLKQRLDFSTKAIVKLVRVFDQLSEKYQRLFSAINSPEVSKGLQERNADLERDNERLQRLNSSLQSRIHEITLRVRERRRNSPNDLLLFQCSDVNNQLVLQEEQFLESKTHLSDLQFELDKSKSKETKLEHSLADVIAKLEHDRLKFQVNEVNQDAESKPNHSNTNTVIIAENRVRCFSRRERFNSFVSSTPTCKQKWKNTKNSP